MIVSVALIALASPAFAATKWKSVYTDIKKDCVVISASTSTAEIDFADSECKAFGGYELHVEGGDIRYNPTLKYNGQYLNIGGTGAFHDPGSDKVEWLYTHKMDSDGAGEIAWKGFIYRLSQATGNGSGPDEQVLYAVRLDKENTCLLGAVKTNVEARKLVYDLSAPCIDWNN